MMAATSTSEKSVLKVRLGNLQPNETVKIEFDLIGRLTSELPNTWTLRIPSHIGPRYQTQTDLIAKLFKNFINLNPNESKGLNLINSEWDFRINLFSSKKIVAATSSSHKTNETIFTEYFRSYSLSEDKVPEKDLEFTF
jgi:hypothetical protein